MSDILAKNLDPSTIIRNAVKGMGDNHSLKRDNTGLVMDANGNELPYTESKGKHPAKIVEGDGINHEGKSCVEAHPKSSHKDWEKGQIDLIEKSTKLKESKKIASHVRLTESKQSGVVVGHQVDKNGKIKSYDVDMGDRIEENVDLRNIEILKEKEIQNTLVEEESKEVGEILEKVMKEEVNKKLLENKIEEFIDEYDATLGFEDDDLGETKDAYNFISQGPFDGRMKGPGYNFKSGGPIQYEHEIKKSLAERIKNLKEDYTSGKLKYDKPKKYTPKKGTPGIEVTEKSLAGSKKENNEHLKAVEKKMKDYLDIPNNSHPEFPHQNNSKTDYKSPMYRNDSEDEEFIDDFRGMGLEDANGVENLERLQDYLVGSSETGNSQEYANAIPDKAGEKMIKKMKRKKEKIAKRKAKMTNLRGITPDVQKVTNVKESKDINHMKKLWSYNKKTQ